MFIHIALGQPGLLQSAVTSLGEISFVAVVVVVTFVFCSPRNKKITLLLPNAHATYMFLVHKVYFVQVWYVCATKCLSPSPHTYPLILCYNSKKKIVVVFFLLSLSEIVVYTFHSPCSLSHTLVFTISFLSLLWWLCVTCGVHRTWLVTRHRCKLRQRGRRE